MEENIVKQVQYILFFLDWGPPGLIFGGTVGCPVGTVFPVGTMQCVELDVSSLPV